MTCQELLDLFAKGRKRYHLIGTDRAGVVAGLDLEGRTLKIRGELGKSAPPPFREGVGG